MRLVADRVLDLAILLQETEAAGLRQVRAWQKNHCL